MYADEICRMMVWSRGTGPASHDDAEHGSDPLTREWLVTNGLGGYASGTISGAVTRRFHGLLISALPAPLGRTMMLSDLSARVITSDGKVVQVGGQEPWLDDSAAQVIDLAEFRLEAGLPVWRYEGAGMMFERRLLLPHGQNTVHVTYTLLKGEGPVQIELQPWVNFRPHEGALDRPVAGPYALTVIEDRYELASPSDLPPLRLKVQGTRAEFRIDSARLRNVRYRIEQSRGYDAVGEFYSPGRFGLELPVSGSVTLVASTEPWETINALSTEEVQRAERKRRTRLLLAAAPEVRSGPPAELILGADQFLITPAGRVEDAARARAAGDEVRTVIAGYHWFTDWGRDTMISLEGLTLVTGRHTEAGYILRTFAHYVKDGLIPNMFPEGKNDGLYHTADATLWFFHALDRYLTYTGDRETLRLVLPTLIDIVEHHTRGTRFGIGVDPKDGLVRQGEEGYQLTWMDAKVGDYVVTPRRGKAVEINALWYNALRLIERWVREAEGDGAARRYGAAAEQAKASFNRRFWSDELGYLYDVLDGERGDDDAFRPNQIFAISLPHPVLDAARWKGIVDQVKARLWTPVGLRSLAPGHPDYKPKYFGDLRARDMAYHQGTVWGWLMGPFIDAWLKVYPADLAGARSLLEGFTPHLDEACAGSISEIFDAEPPFTPRGCVAQAWSVAEVLRAYARTARSAG
ncbi:amylo-alpha-1,6-glucosidase [Sorangium cellulosum]|uniref:Glycogen debranching protein n=3 Tax=Sorangium cellulosum TaxID=56 RepID=A0A150U089_SORCE|nr:amylo-alpha-1,6-glucosidase [Sorangium cellulosum]AGP40488.1 glycogen debranching protein [Sorangium cellulosum So0157-2]KYG10188.1 glycogen debranching protein [Sorangium cellulosum]